MTEIERLRLVLRKINEQAEAGQSGSANYAMDRLAVVRNLVKIAFARLDKIEAGRA